MPDTKAAPALRFNGFADAWGLCKVGEIIEDYVEKTVVQNQYPVLTSSQQQGIVMQEDYFADRQVTTDDNIGYFVLPRGYFTYRSRSDTDVFVFNRNNLIDKGIISYYYPVFMPNGVDSDFLLRRLNYGMKRQLARAAEGTGQKVLAHNRFKEMEFLLPSASEQERIGELFEQLDSLITLHQRKYDLLVRAKKAMLEKMFPQNGAAVPEIRFAGFADTWKQRKLGELARFSKGTGYTKADLKETGIPIILYGRLYTNYETVISNVDTYTEARQGSIYSNGGEVIVPASGETAEDISIASVVEKSGILLGGDLNIITPSSDLNSAFLAISISNGKPHSDMAKMAQGKSVVHLHNTDLEKIELTFPSLAEQQKISSYYRQLDSLITLHQQKHEKLKQLKQSLLEKMFV